MNLKDSGLRFAFAIEGYLDHELKNDTRFVKQIARIVTKLDGVTRERFIDYHRCTTKDLNEFAPPTSDSKALLKSFQTDDDRGLYCLDWDALGDELEIWGVNDDANYQRFEFLLLPCNYVHAEYGETDDSVSSDCIANRETQMAYLGNMKLVIYMNE